MPNYYNEIISTVRIGKAADGRWYNCRNIKSRVFFIKYVYAFLRLRLLWVHELHLCLMTERMSFIYPKAIVVRVSAIIGDESVMFGQVLTEKVQKMA